MRVLVLGSNGMIGSTMLRVLAQSTELEVVGAVRGHIQPDLARVVGKHLVAGGDLSNSDVIAKLIADLGPDAIVNCAGLTKHLQSGNQPISAISMNSLLPHRLLELCRIRGARLIHVSTDCVFSGRKGNYREDDEPDASDVYGKSKQLGEVISPGAITLRTSTIGHEFGTQLGLLEWFFAQERCKGFRRAIFSGLPTVEFARVVRDLVIPNRDIEGLYHVGAAPIDKHSLLQLIGDVYGTTIEIEPSDDVVIDRSLNSEKFAQATGYRAASWPELIKDMHRDRPDH